MTRRLRAVLVDDDRVLLVFSDGSTEELLAPGHPRPGVSHATATTRRGAA